VNLSHHKIKNLKLFRAQLATWFQREGRDLPWRRTREPYAVLVAELMLQQTQVATVLAYYGRWLTRFPDLATLAAASEAEVLSVWQGLGYYSRARNLHRAAQQVVAQFRGVLPPDPALLATLPGVGRYSAGAIAAFAFDLPVPAVDGNIARVLSRLIDLRSPIDMEPGRSILWKVASELLPKRRGRLHTSALMELGALLCTARHPRCGICPVRAHCTTREPETLPQKRARPARVELDESCAWIFDRRHLLLEQQIGRQWRGLWKLPRLAVAPGAGQAALSLTYPFTNHRVTLRIFRRSRPRQIAENQAWISIARLATLALAAPHRRAITNLLRLHSD
jgi:A/G-specific adenine glycosylase